MPYRWFEKQSDGTLLELNLVGVTQEDPSNPDNIISKPVQVSNVGDPIAPSTPLGPVISPTSSMVSRTSAVLYWSAPNNTGRPSITDYRIYRKDNGGVETYIDNTGSGSILTFTDTSLPTSTPEIIFTYIVRAVNSDGIGDASSGIFLQWSGTPSPQPPSAPFNLARGALTSSYVILTWDFTYDSSVLKQAIYNNETLLVDNIDKAAKSYTWNLPSGTSYSQINVRRYNSSGWSGKSSPSNISFTIPQPSSGLFFGHQTGKVYIGMTVGPQTNSPYNGSEPSWETMVTNTIQVTGVYADRIYAPNFGTKAQTDLSDTAAKRRIPWISNKPNNIASAAPNTLAGWSSIASGTYDAQIRSAFDDLLDTPAANNGPIVWTFHHEPQQVGRTAAYGAAFNDAFNRIIDIAKSRPTWNDKIIFGPNYMEYLWRASDSRDISGADHLSWFPESALSRWDFFSWDMYPWDNGTNTTSLTDWDSIHPIMRIQRIFNTLSSVGYPNMMCGIGEFAQRYGYTYPSGTESGRDLRSGTKWVRMLLDYVTNNPDRFWLVSYFNSDGGVANESLMWPKESFDTESTMDVFREKLSISARLSDL